MNIKHLISINDLTLDEIKEILDLSAYFEKNSRPDLMQNKIGATLFYEPSTRTRLSFETAIQKLGGRVIGFADTSTSSVQKGESLKDTILTVANYADVIVLRHPLEGSARFASEVSKVPVINAGDGANQHPTQTLLDLYSILKTQGKLDNLHITMVGDLKYGRTVHSLVQAMVHFNPTFYFVAHELLQIPQEYKLILEKHNIKYYLFNKLDEVIGISDIIYMTRVQRERFSDPMEYERTKNLYILSAEMLTNTKPNLKILHPLPRVNEININVDETPQAYYFEQALNGVYVRQAILAKILNLKI